MTKEEIITIIKRKINEHQRESDKQHIGDYSGVAISSYESGCARGLEEALGLIGMLDKPNKISKNGSNEEVV